MKRIFTLFLIAWSIVAPMSAQFRYGLGLGVDFSRVSFNKAVLDSREQQGFFFGPKIRANIKNFGLGFDASVRYMQKSLSVIDDISEAERQTYQSEKMSYIQVPINVRWDLEMRNWGLFVATGPQWNWYIGEGSWSSAQEFAANFEHSIASWNIGGGVFILGHLNLGVTLNFPLSGNGSYVSEAYNKIRESFSQGTETLEMKDYSWQINFDFFF